MSSIRQSQASPSFAGGTKRILSRDIHWLAATGHANIELACGYPIPAAGQSYERRAWQEVHRDLLSFLVDHYMGIVSRNGLGLVSGMCRGVDEIWARLAIDLDLPLVLAIPGSVRWHKTRGPSRGIRAQAIGYEEILAYPGIERVVEVGKDWGGGTYKFLNFARNAAVVDVADAVVAYSRRASPGTADCMFRAKRAGKFAGNAAGWADGYAKPRSRPRRRQR